MSTKSSSTHRPSRAPSRRTGLVPASRIFSSTLSTIAPTCRSLGAEAITKQSVITSWSDTSSTITSLAFLSAAAFAATRASLRASCVAATSLLSVALLSPSRVPVRASRFGCLGVEVALLDILHDPVGHEVPDGLAGGHPCPAGGRGDRHGRDLD